MCCAVVEPVPIWGDTVAVLVGDRWIFYIKCSMSTRNYTNSYHMPNHILFARHVH